MSRKKKIYKKKGSVIKNLTRDIFKILNNDTSKFYNYKQIAEDTGTHTVCADIKLNEQFSLKSNARDDSQ